MRRGCRLTAALGLGLFLATATAWPREAAPATDAATVVEQLSAVVADPSRAVAIRNYRLRSGPATIELEEGVLVPGPVIGKRPVEFAFLGSGRILLDPVDPIEAGQLELFTGARSLDETFRRAVLVIALDAAADAILGLPAAPADPRAGGASDLIADWHASAERRLLEVDARLFADAAGNPVGSTFFCGSFEGESLGRFLYVVDVANDEQVTLGQLVRPDLDRRQRRKASRRIEREQRQGRLIGVEVGDLGRWDTWVSTQLVARDGRGLPGTPGVEPLHYTIEATLAGSELELEGRARIRLGVLIDGLRTATLDMARDLTLVAVADEAGRLLPCLRSPTQLTVWLPEAVAAGQEQVVEVTYRGRPLEREVAGTYAQRDTLGWYPHAGQVDRATYDVTLRWPQELELEGSGRVVGEGVDEGGLRWQHRLLEHPSLGFSFEVGHFRVASGRTGHVQVTVAVDAFGQRAIGDVAGDVLATVQDSLAYFEGAFGPYPLDHLTVVSAPRGLSQGLLGYLTMSTAGIQDWEDWGDVLGIQDRRLLIAHEVAHQWWGNLVGWESYRDQWISEAMANYAALAYARDRLGTGAARNGPIRGWEMVLLRQAANGQPVESLGPVVLGRRLSSSLGGGAYRAIVYVKGALILNMLASFTGSDRFAAALHDVVRVASGRLLSTAGFLELVGRSTGSDLAWFRRQYVEGTGLPDMSYEYRVVEEDDGAWSVEGRVEPRSATHVEYRISRRADRALDVVQERVKIPVAADWVVACPLQVGVLTQEEAEEGSHPKSEAGLVRGRVVVGHDHPSFRFSLSDRPQVVWLDRDQEVFARFSSPTLEPRRAAYQRGLDLLAEGRTEEAGEAFRSALQAPVSTAPEAWRGADWEVDREGKLLAAAIRIALARLALDDERPTAARQDLAAARELTAGMDSRQLDPALTTLETRLELRAGKAGAVLRRLRRMLLVDRDLDTPEAWALLTVAAHTAGREKELGEACAVAARRGVDVSALGCAAGSRTTIEE